VSLVTIEVESEVIPELGPALSMMWQTAALSCRIVVFLGCSGS